MSLAKAPLRSKRSKRPGRDAGLSGGLSRQKITKERDRGVCAVQEGGGWGQGGREGLWRNTPTRRGVVCEEEGGCGGVAAPPDNARKGRRLTSSSGRRVAGLERGKRERGSDPLG